MKPARTTHELVGDMRVLSRSMAKVKHPESRAMLRDCLASLCLLVLHTRDATEGMREAALRMNQDAANVVDLDREVLSA